jgi:hypothetical protein
MSNPATTPDGNLLFPEQTRINSSSVFNSECYSQTAVTGLIRIKDGAPHLP